MKTKTWIAIFAGVCILCAGALLLLSGKKSNVAEIYQDGKLLYTIELDKVSEPYDLKIEGDWRSNTVHVIPGDLCVTSASCPDGVCINHGYLSTRAGPIVCLPNRLVIQYRSSDPAEVDAVAGVAQ